jgi:pyrroloquinoline quinone biosynthesis protein B
MLVRILGSAAGGGFPQWNCGCGNCVAVRSGAPGFAPRTQSSVAVSATGGVWFLLNVSPDVRAQIAAFPPLAPGAGTIRGTAIGGCLLTDAEIDHTAGLLALREGESFPIYVTRAVHRWLHHDFPVAPVVAAFCGRPWITIDPGIPFELESAAEGPSGLRVLPFELGRVSPRYAHDGAIEHAGAVVGLIVEDRSTSRRLVHAPRVPEFGEALDVAADGADLLLLDGTLWSGDEIDRVRGTAAGYGEGPPRHWPVGGAGGSLAWLDRRAPRRPVYVHINNTNPMLAPDGGERRAVERLGVRIAADGDTFEL